MESYQDAYVFLRSAENPPDALLHPSAEIESLPFDLTTGPNARLYVLKSDTLAPIADLLRAVATLELDKALALLTPYRIVHYGVFRIMAFVRVRLTPTGDAQRVLQAASRFHTFKGGAPVQGSYDMLLEFGDDEELEAVQADADAVRTISGVLSRSTGLFLKTDESA